MRAIGTTVGSGSTSRMLESRGVGHVEIYNANDLNNHGCPAGYRGGHVNIRQLGRKMDNCSSVSICGERCW